MKKLEKILDILENSNPSETDKKFLDSNKSDEEVKKLVDVYNALKTVLIGSIHLDTDILGDYILYKRGDEKSVEYISLVSDKIETHLKTCDPCSKEYNILSAELDSINNYLDKRITGKKEEQPVLFLFQKSIGFRYAVATVLVLLISYFGLRIVSDISTPYYKQQIFSAKEDDNYITRGRTSILFQKSLNALENKEYEDAIKLLTEDIEQNKNDKSIFYSYYVLGITYLKTSESDFLGAFKSFDSDKVHRAIESLESSIEKNNSGYFNNLKLDAHYYIARGYLMLDEVNTAENHLNIVVDKRGRFYKKAEELLNSLEKI